MKPLFLSCMYTLCYSLVLTGCGEQPYSIGKLEPGPISKGRMIKGAAGEIAPVIFQGKPYLISFADVAHGPGFIQVQSYPDLKVLSRAPFDYNYGSAIVVGDRVHVFGSSITTQGPGNRIATASSTDLVNWTTPTVIFQAPSNQTVYNSTVTATPTGFVMAYEIHEEGNPIWWINGFLSSPDLTTWTQTNGLYSPYGGSACPTLRYQDGYYYLFSLRDRFANLNGSQYYTTVARSKDLVNWEESGREVLSSAGRPDEGVNNSDLELLDYNGGLVVFYLVGDQVTFGFMKEGYYLGTLKNFLLMWFV